MNILRFLPIQSAQARGVVGLPVPLLGGLPRKSLPGVFASLWLSLVLAAVYPPSAPAAGPAWSKPHTLAARSGAPCDVAVRSNGQVFATWTTSEPSRGRRRERAFLARRLLNGAWSARKTIWDHVNGVRGSSVSNGIYAYCPQIALGKSGSLDVLWDEHRETAIDPENSQRVRNGPSRLLMRRLHASGKWSRKRRLATRSSLSLRGAVQVSERGHAIAVLDNVDKVISRSAAGRWGKPQRIRGRTRIDASNSQAAAIGEDGSAVVAWNYWPGRGSIRAVFRSGTRRWSRQQALSDTSSRCPAASDPRAAVSAEGSALVGWVCSNASEAGQSLDRTAVRTASIARGQSRWQPEQELDRFETPIVDNQQAAYPGFDLRGVSFDGAGVGYVIYTASTGRQGSPIPLREARLIPGAASWAPPVDVLPDFRGMAIDFVMQDDGAGLVTGAFRRSTWRSSLTTAFRHPDGTWSGPSIRDAATSDSHGWASIGGGVAALIAWGSTLGKRNARAVGIIAARLSG